MASSQLEDAFMFAVHTGRKWLVEKLVVYSNVDPCMRNGEPLRVAVQFNRLGVVQYLLSLGCDPNQKSEGTVIPIVLACRLGHAGITKVLLEAGAIPVDTAMLDAISNVHSGCVHALLEYSCSVSFREHEPIFRAYYLGNKQLVQLLLAYGADINARDGEMLIDAATMGRLDMVQFLLRCGADPNARHTEALRQSAQRGHSSVVDTLLRAGADDAQLSDIALDYFVKKVVGDYQRRFRMNRMVKAVKASFDRDTFRWQGYCRKYGNDQLSGVQQQSKLFGIKGISHRTKRELCMELAKTCEDMIGFDESLDDYDLYGNAMSELPKWKLYHLHGRVYNVFDLFRLIRKGYTSCPYTRLPLPTQDIERRRRWLEKVLTRNTLSDFNLVEQVRNSPLFSKELELKTLLTTEVWSRLSYPCSMDVVLKGSDFVINDILVNIYKLANDMIMYPMLSSIKKWQIQNASGLLKKELFINTLVEIVQKADLHQVTRTQMLSIIFQHYNDDGTPKDGEDDLFSFMMMDESDESSSSGSGGGTGGIISSEYDYDTPF